MDPIANMLTIIRNGQMVGKESVKIPYSNFKFELANLLLELGFLGKVEKSGKKEKRYLDIDLTYEGKSPTISEIKRLSKPSRKVYNQCPELKWPKGSVLIVSTSKGLMTGQKAKRNRIGGELICLVS